MLHDIKQAVRGLIKSPGFTALALLITTLGIGATVAAYAIADAVALWGLPYEGGDWVISVTLRNTKTGRFRVQPFHTNRPLINIRPTPALVSGEALS